jgi:methyltransferase (TIGR00027 family)
MRRTRPSATAEGVAAWRAVESEKPAGERICYDPYARRLTGALFYHLIKLLAGYGERYTHGALTFIVCRARYFDDYIRERLKAGTAQLVILGAGLDSRAYREDLVPGAVTTFEVDHPATQASKIERVKKVFGGIPARVVYVPVDFSRETLDRLLGCGFDPTLATLFVWEGVTPYLDAAAVNATLGWVRANAPPGSAIIFDYLCGPGTAAPPRRNRLYALVSRLSGERREFDIEQARIEDFLVQRGFARVVNADAEQLRRLYCTGPNRNRTVAANYAIVHAETEASRSNAGHARFPGAVAP